MELKKDIILRLEKLNFTGTEIINMAISTYNQGWQPDPYRDLGIYNIINITSWSEMVENEFRLIFGPDAPQTTNFISAVKDYKQAVVESKARSFINSIPILVGMVNSAKKLIETDYPRAVNLPIIKRTFSSTFDKARELLKQNLKDASALYARVILEITLKEIITMFGFSIDKKKPGINDYKEILYSQKKINKQEMLAIQRWATIGNDAAHGRFNQYKNQDVSDMLNWIEQFANKYMK